MVEKRMFKSIIARTPSSTLINGLTTSNLGKPDLEKALAQHTNYLDVLKSVGCDITLLESNDQFPDSCFMEDVAVCTPTVAILTRPGAPSRLAEVELAVDTIKQQYKDRAIEYIVEPGFLDGGDIMMVDDTYYIGLSSRTNENGANQLIEILKKYGMNGVIVKVSGGLHLKTGVAYIENNTFIGWSSFKYIFENIPNFKYIEIPNGEEYAANCIHVNGYVLIPDNHPQTEQLLLNNNFKVIKVNTSEFQKLDGGLSCLSLRIP